MQVLLTQLDDGRMLLVHYWSSNPPEIYDPASGTWSDTGFGTGVSRLYHSASLLPDGKVMVMGGLVDNIASTTQRFTIRVQTHGVLGQP